MEPVKLMAPNGCKIVGTKDLVQGIALVLEVIRDEDGGVDVEYVGETEMDWDSQVTVERDGKRVFIDENDEEWTEDQLVPVDDAEGEQE
jgi:hypothetical protein